MRITKPSYFDSFTCLAGNCPDSCCKEWDVQVDEKSAAFYRSLPGALGDRLRQVMYTEDEEVYLAIEDRRCPMWREDGLCRIQAELGHDALCKTCRDFPRLTHDYGDFIEMGLELSCPEAARLILSSENSHSVTENLTGGETPEYDTDAMAVLLRTRETALAILRNDAYTPNEALAQLLYYGYQAQGELDGDPEADFAPVNWDTIGFASADTSEFFAFFQNLEILTPQWQEHLSSPAVPGQWEENFRNLAQYFVERYWLQSVSDYDLVCRVKLAVISCLAIHFLGGNLTETAQIYSKEIENSANNVDALLDAAYTCEAFTDQNLLGLLLNV
jgi:lysine-N-methylase